jgi:4-hydroxy-tetrahydrodipicolinate synthase
VEDGLNFQGVFSVLPTPFSRNGEIDYLSLRKVVDLYIRAGVNGLTALGVTGEVARLTDKERFEVLEAILSHVKGRVPVVAGCTADGLRASIEYSRHAQKAGASAVMVSPPRMPKVNSAAVLRHYAELSAAIELPIVVQDYPPVSGYALEPVLIARIARDLPAARTIKLEDSPTPLKITRILEQAQSIPVQILGGLGGVFLLEELTAGAAGAMTGFACPEVLVKVVKLFRAGQVDEAADAFYRAVPLMRFEFQEGIGMAIRKEILRRRGALADAAVRAPGAALDPTTAAQLDRQLEWVWKTGGIEWT